MPLLVLTWAAAVLADELRSLYEHKQIWLTDGLSHLETIGAACAVLGLALPLILSDRTILMLDGSERQLVDYCSTNGRQRSL